MIQRDKLPHVTSMSLDKGRVDFEIEGLVDGPVPSLADNSTPVIFIGAFCDSVVMCIGVVDEYEVVDMELTRLGMRGPVISFNA